MPVMHSVYRESGTVAIDRDACSRCGQCAGICPTEVLVKEDGEVRIHPENSFGCIACGHCMMVCPSGAVAVTGRGISPEDLMPLPAAEERATADQLAALMLSRRSVRYFSDREVEAETLERIAEMASSAPMGIPPWDVGCVTIRGREEVQQLVGDVIKGYEGFQKVFRPWVIKLLRPFWRKATYDVFAHFILPLAEEYVEAWRQGRDVLFYNAPAVMLFHHSPYAEQTDAVIACTYAMLAAESLGLGSTMIGGAAPIIQRDKKLSGRLGIPEGNKACIALIVGYPTTHFRRAVRRHFLADPGRRTGS